MMPCYETYEMKVRQFTRAMGQPIGAPFDPRLLALRTELLQEEFKEFMVEASAAQLELLRYGHVEAHTRANLLKELSDLQYVLSGFAVTFDLPIEIAFNRVHASNMSKLGEDGKPMRREDGKVLKGPNYAPPFLGDL